MSIHHNATILLRRMQPLLQRASTMPSSHFHPPSCRHFSQGVSWKCVPLFFHFKNTFHFSISSIIGCQLLHVVILGRTMIWPAHITLGEVCSMIFEPIELVLDNNKGLAWPLALPLLKDFLRWWWLLWWRYDSKMRQYMVSVLCRTEAERDSKKKDFLPRVTPEAKSLLFFASTLYASVLEPGQNSKNNRCQIPFLH